MLFRNDGTDVIAISQPTHCWLSGQLARNWGNDGFAVPLPYEEACLGAELHDIGWLSWEAAPTLDPGTGRPHDFRAVDARTHTELWTSGVRLALAFGRYPALLVSLHANTIYGAYFNFAKASPEDARLVRAFLAEQQAFQERTIESLAGEPRYQETAAPAAIERNRLLVAATDWMSLEICWGVTEEARVPRTPSVGEQEVDLHLRAPRRDPADLIVDPWPFSADSVEVMCEGRRLHGRFSDEPAMRQALAAPDARVAITARLRPR
jgi:hypothetical protein